MPTFLASLSIPAFDHTSDRVANPDVQAGGVSHAGNPNRTRAKLPAKAAARTAAKRLHGRTNGVAIVLVLLVLCAASEHVVAADRHASASIAMPEFGALRPIDSGGHGQDWLQFPPRWAREPRAATIGAPLQFGKFSLTGVTIASTGQRPEDRRSEGPASDLQDATFPLSRYLLGIRRRFGLNVRPVSTTKVLAPHKGSTSTRRKNVRDPEFVAQPVVEQPLERPLESGVDDGSWTTAPLFTGRANGADATPTASSEKRSKGAPNADEVPLDKRPERATNAAPEAAKAPVNPLFITRSNGGT